MADVFFKLRPDLGKVDREGVLRRIESLPGVSHAAPVKPEARSPALLAYCFARIDDGSDAESLATILQEMPEVQSADTPARRGLPNI